MPSSLPHCSPALRGCRAAAAGPHSWWRESTRTAAASTHAHRETITTACGTAHSSRPQRDGAQRRDATHRDARAPKRTGTELTGGLRCVSDPIAMSLAITPDAIISPAAVPRESSKSKTNSSGSVSRVRVHTDETAADAGDADHVAVEVELASFADACEKKQPDYTIEDAQCGLTSDTDSHRSKKSSALHAELDSYTHAESKLTDRSLPKSVRRFYAAQNELLDGYRVIVNLGESDSSAASTMDKEREAAAASDDQTRAVKIAVEGSLVLTVIMIAVKFSAAIWSGSIAVIASAVDSALDLVSQCIMAATGRFMSRKDAQKYPIGKSRTESLAVLIFGTIMGLAALFLMYQSALILIDGLASRPEIRVDTVTLALLGSTIVAQLCACLYCRRVASRGGRNVGAVEAIAADHVNDIVSNSFGLASAVVAAYNAEAWFMDPVGGLCISIYIFTRWALVCHEQFVALLGASADPAFLSQLTYLALHHDPRILAVDTVLAYRIGTKLHCEVHIALPGDMTLRVAHDIGESLEKNIEKLPDVELAWVHLDFEWSHIGEHRRWEL